MHYKKTKLRKNIQLHSFKNTTNHLLMHNPCARVFTHKDEHFPNAYVRNSPISPLLGSAKTFQSSSTLTILEGQPKESRTMFHGEVETASVTASKQTSGREHWNFVVVLFGSKAFQPVFNGNIVCSRSCSLLGRRKPENDSRCFSIVVRR